MSKLKSTNEIDVYERDNKECLPSKEYKLIIQSHWNRSSMVVLKFEDTILTVSADELLMAITNAKNVGI